MVSEIEVRVEEKAKISPGLGLGLDGDGLAVVRDSERGERARIASSDEVGEFELVKFDDNADGEEDRGYLWVKVANDHDVGP